MTVVQFNKLPLQERIAIVEDEAIYLEAFYFQTGCKVALFIRDNLYFEVWINKQTSVVERVWAFTSYERLDPFLTSISIKEFIK